MGEGMNVIRSSLLASCRYNRELKEAQSLQVDRPMVLKWMCECELSKG